MTHSRPDNPHRERPLRLLLLAGSAEGRQIAGALARVPGVQARAALPRAEWRPIPLGLPTRIGGWGGREAFAKWLRAERLHAVIDATHPFAARMSNRAAEVTDALGLDYIRFVLPSWRPGPGDRWTFLNTAADAARHVPEDATVFLSTGRHTLPAFAALAGRTVYCRLIDAPLDPFPFAKGGFVRGRRPFAVEDERELLAELRVDWVVAHNTGSREEHAKLDAARTLGLPVALLRRPAPPEGVTRCGTMSELMAWVARRVQPAP